VTSPDTVDYFDPGPPIEELRNATEGAREATIADSEAIPEG
jgi:hypothetical protein